MGWLFHRELLGACNDHIRIHCRFRGVFRPCWKKTGFSDGKNAVRANVCRHGDLMTHNDKNTLG